MVTSMNALRLLAASAAASLACFALSPPAQAQFAPRGAHPARGATSVQFGYYGPGYWRGPGRWPGYWWGPGYWGPRYGFVYPPAYGYLPPAYGYIPPAYGYAAPAYGYVPPAFVAPNPPVYVERDPPAAPAAPVWWYWCAEASAYYPYVKECPGGWQRVPPQAVPPGEKP
jgi:hypothetical protein